MVKLKPNNLNLWKKQNQRSVFFKFCTTKNLFKIKEFTNT